MLIEIKVLDPRAAIPQRGTLMSAGYDLIACIDQPLSIRRGEKATLIPTGLAMFIGEAGVAGLILPRSGLGHKQGLNLGNTLGLVDGDYQNQWFVSAWNRGQQDEIVINPGDRIAQAIFVPVIHPIFRQVEEFSGLTERGLGGFGSTGVSESLKTPGVICAGLADFHPALKYGEVAPALVRVSDADADAINALVASPPAPNEALRAAAERYRASILPGGGEIGGPGIVNDGDVVPRGSLGEVVEAP